MIVGFTRIIPPYRIQTYENADHANNPNAHSPERTPRGLRVCWEVSEDEEDDGRGLGARR